MKKLIIALMMLCTSTLYSQGELGMTIEQVNARLNQYGMPSAVQGISQDTNVWVLEMGDYGEMKYYINPRLGLTTKTMVTFFKKKYWREQKRLINRSWVKVYTEKSSRFKKFRQYTAIDVDGFLIYCNIYEECLTIEYMIEDEEMKADNLKTIDR